MTNGTGRLAARVPTQRCRCMARAIPTSSPQGSGGGTRVPKARAGAGPRGASIGTRPASSENSAVPDRSGLSRSGWTGIAGSLPTAPMVPGGRVPASQPAAPASAAVTRVEGQGPSDAGDRDSGPRKTRPHLAFSASLAHNRWAVKDLINLL